MAGFVVQDEIDVLNWDFTPYAGTGVTPEPSAKALKTFRRTMVAIMGSAVEEITKAATPGEQTDQLRAALAAMPEQEAKIDEIEEATNRALAKVCSDSPSHEDITALPPRLRQAFTGYMIGKLLRPEAQTPATSK